MNSATHAIVNGLGIDAVEGLRETIIRRGDLAHVSVKQQLAHLKDLSSFPLGRFLIERRGADGFWTDYIINYPQMEAGAGLNSEGVLCSLVEKFILEKSPLTLATRERFKIFQTCTQRYLKDHMDIASIPCGIMRDLLSLNYSSFSSFSITGVDLDPKSLAMAKQLASEYGLEDRVQFFRRDAWHLLLDDQFDLITSSGLNVYVSEAEKLLQLYRAFFRALRKGGTLVTGALTYPPGYPKKSEWVLEKLPSSDILMENILFHDILGCKWRNFRTSDEIYEDFYSAGFVDVEVIFDPYHICPTVIATK